MHHTAGVVGGDCDERFNAVRDAFAANFTAGLEAGAACAVVIDGQVVVDLWAGIADEATGGAWGRDTLVDCRSSTKGLTALSLAMLVDRGLADFDAAVRTYWPELRIDPTLREALSHQAGIPVIDDVPVGAILDWEVMAEAVAHQEPMWAPGERHGYHGTSFGWLVGQPVRRASGTTLADFLQREVFDRLGVDGYMGTPVADHGRMATLSWGRPAHGAATPPPGSAAGDSPSLAQRMYAPVLPPLAPAMNDAAFRGASIPVTGAAVTARTLAAVFGELSCDGGRLVSATVARELGEVQVEGDDVVFGVPISRTLGYERTPAWADDGRPDHCWGSPGGGGVVTFADPVARVGFAYVNNASWSGPPGQDPRAAGLTRALYTCL